MGALLGLGYCYFYHPSWFSFFHRYHLITMTYKKHNATKCSLVGVEREIGSNGHMECVTLFNNWLSLTKFHLTSFLPLCLRFFVVQLPFCLLSP